jgi:hypothetical protein
MTGWQRWMVGCAVLGMVGVAGPCRASVEQAPKGGAVSSSDVWPQRVARVDELWRSGQAPQAKREFLAYGRGPATTELRRIVKESPEGDLTRLRAGFVLYVLDLDRALGRSVLVRACRHGSRPDPFDAAFGLATSAYWHRPDRALLGGVLELTPYADGGAADDMLGFVAKAATMHTRDLLLVLRKKPVRLRRSVATALTPQLGGRPARRAYPEVTRIADRASDPMSAEARRLLRDIDKAEKRQQWIAALNRRQQ